MKKDKELEKLKMLIFGLKYLKIMGKRVDGRLKKAEDLLQKYEPK